MNFTRGSERLGMAQPPLSVAIGKLERKLGVSLRERNSRRVSLTPAGTVLLEHGRIALEGLGAAVERTKRRGPAPDRLTVAVKADGSTDLLREVLRRCAEQPGMPEVTAEVAAWGEPSVALREGTADVALLRTPFEPRGLDTEVLLVEPRVAVLPAGHRLAGRKRLRRADLAGEPMPRWAGADERTAAYWAGRDPESVDREWPDEHHPATPQGPEVSDLNQLLETVALGRAVAYVPMSVTRRYRRDDVVSLPVSDLSGGQVLVAWPEVSRSAAVATFDRLALEVAESHPDRAAAFG
ncbi:LysR family transcriptional regulator [Streptomyces sp. NPDC003758]